MARKKHKKEVIGRDGMVKTVVRVDRAERCQRKWAQSVEVATSKASKKIGPGVWILIVGAGVVFFALLVWGVVMMTAVSPDREVEPVVAGKDLIKQQMLDARQVADAFLAEPDPQKRLSYVRYPEVVNTHIARYDEEVLTASAVEIREMGSRVADEGGESAYVVKFASGGARLLSVVTTGQGPKVDWDSYARYCSESWDALFAGDVSEALVRVFVRPGDYHVGAFRDPRKWTCFLLEVPDCDRRIYAYAPAGSVLSKRVQSEVMKTRSFRQHMTLNIKSHAGSGQDALFVVDALLAVGWVVDGR